MSSVLETSQIITASLQAPGAYREATELEIMKEYLPLDGATVLELGCGRAWMTRRMAEDFPVARIVATEVDQIQHEKNMMITDLPTVEFKYGGMQQIDLPDGSVDIVTMLKSLHHVPQNLMKQGFDEVFRVLKPGGVAYISEPVYAGDFNEIMSLFNDEKIVREQAFSALCEAIEKGAFEHAAEVFFESPGQFDNWDAFEDRMLNVTHTKHSIDAELYQRIKAAFMEHMTSSGAFFKKPSRVDLLRKPA